MYIIQDSGEETNKEQSPIKAIQRTKNSNLYKIVPLSFFFLLNYFLVLRANAAIKGKTKPFSVHFIIHILQNYILHV